MKNLFIFTVLIFFCLNAIFAQGDFSLPLEVDYDIAIAEAIKKGNYYFIDEKVILCDFKSSESEKEYKKISITLFSFEEQNTSEEIIEKMKRYGFRPATSIEGFAFGHQYPLIQLKKPVVILGSMIDNKVIFLYETFKDKKNYEKQKKGKRAIGLTSWKNQWNNKYYFIGVPL